MCLFFCFCLQNPTLAPSNDPTDAHAPTANPTAAQSNEPTIGASYTPTLNPTGKTSQPPSNKPSLNPTVLPSNAPIYIHYNSDSPTGKPLGIPTRLPSDSPTNNNNNNNTGVINDGTNSENNAREWQVDTIILMIAVIVLCILLTLCGMMVLFYKNKKDEREAEIRRLELQQGNLFKTKSLNSNVDGNAHAPMHNIHFHVNSVNDIVGNLKGEQIEIANLQQLGSRSPTGVSHGSVASDIDLTGIGRDSQAPAAINVDTAAPGGIGASDGMEKVINSVNLNSIDINILVQDPMQTPMSGGNDIDIDNDIHINDIDGHDTDNEDLYKDHVEGRIDHDDNVTIGETNSQEYHL